MIQLTSAFKCDYANVGYNKFSIACPQAPFALQFALPKHEGQKHVLEYIMLKTKQKTKQTYNL